MSDLHRYTVYFDEISKIMKKTHFWKFVAFGTSCIKQEYEVYEQLAKDRFFDMSKFLNKTVERFWKVAATGYSMDEQYIFAVEESFFIPRDGWEELALQFVQDLQEFFYAVSEKDEKRCLGMQERQVAFVEKYTQVAGLTSEQSHILLEKTLKNHIEMAKELVAIPAKDKKSFLEEFSTRNPGLLLGEDYLINRPKQKPEKTGKKKLPEIRVTSIDFDREKRTCDNGWLLHSIPEQWVLGCDCNVNDKGAYAEYYRERDLLDLCHVMDVRYCLLAEDDYIQHRDAMRVRGFWYLYALTWLRAYQLREKGYPVKRGYYFERHEKGDDGFQPVFNRMLGAYASGEDWMLPEIQRFSSEKEKPLTAPLLQLLTGENSQKLYSLVEAWEDCDRKKIILAILCGDKKEIRKQLLHMIRRDRQMYDMNRTMVDIEAYAFMKLTKERGIGMEPIIAAEVLDGNLDMTPVDKSFFKLPYQEEIEEWLMLH